MMPIDLDVVELDAHWPLRLNDGIWRIKARTANDQEYLLKMRADLFAGFCEMIAKMQARHASELAAKVDRLAKELQEIKKKM